MFSVTIPAAGQMISPVGLFLYGLAIAGALLFIGLAALGLLFLFYAIVAPDTQSDEEADTALNAVNAVNAVKGDEHVNTVQTPKS